MKSFLAAARGSSCAAAWPYLVELILTREHFEDNTQTTRHFSTLAAMSDSDASAGPRDSAQTVLAALRKATTPASPEEIAEATGLSESTVRRTLGRLVSVREARRAGGGRFTAAKHGTMGR
jgi:response regulator of citrate/malate metabolism